MRVMVVCQDFRHWRSGHDAAVHATVRALAGAGVEVTVLAGRIHAGAVAAAGSGVRVRWLPSLPVWHGSIHLLTLRFAWAVLGRHLARRADVVYLASPLLGRGDVAAVHFLSGDWLEARRPVVGGWRSHLRRAHDLFRHTLAARLEARAYGGDGPLLLPVSHGLAGRLAVRYPACAGRLRMVPSPLDIRAFHPDGPALEPSDFGWPQGARLLAFVGGAWTRKRLDRVLAALALLPLHVCLVVLGRGPKAEMRALAARLGVAGRVAFLGQGPAVAPLLRASAALVLPSDYETDGRVAWEALACGVPVIAAPFAGSGDWLRPGETALAARTPEEIAIAVQALLADAALGPRLGAVGRRLVERIRAPEAVAARLLEVLAEVRR